MRRLYRLLFWAGSRFFYLAWLHFVIANYTTLAEVPWFAPAMYVFAVACLVLAILEGNQNYRELRSREEAKWERVRAE